MGRSERHHRFLPGLPALLAAAALATVTGGTAAPDALAAAGPSAKARPMVAGEATQGKRLFGVKGTWKGSGKITYAYQWFRCDQMGAHCASLRGVTKRSHVLAAGDVGHTLGLSVKATDARGSTTAVSKLIGPIGGSPPVLVSTVQPTITGEASDGGTLKVNQGTWSPAPESFSYQWARCSALGRGCAPIAGATADTHAVAAPDIGHALVAIVQARSGAATQAVFSVATAAVGESAETVAVTGPTNSAPPQVAVIVQQGRQLTGAIGAWAGDGAIAYAYQWHRCDMAGSHCTSIHGATSRTYTLVAKDVGQTLGFSVSATDTTGTTRAYAPLVGPVASPLARLVSTGQPTVTGTPKEGQALEVSAGSWSPTPAEVTYQWQRCNRNGRLCAPIAGATATTYAVTAADTGHALLAVVRATVGTAAQVALSTSTPAVVAPSTTGPSTTVLPAVAGTGQVGKQLTGSIGSWAGSGTIDYAYQWYRCDAAGAHCLSVSGATNPTYTLVPRDAGQTIGFAVHATDSTGTASAYASLIGPIATATATLVSTMQPTITGVARQGQTLQAAAGTWGITPTALTYAWQRCNPNGRLCVPITGATTATYVVTAADVGATLVVLVHAQAAGVTQAVLSLATARVT